MKIIISCCNRKNGDSLILNGQLINFVSHPIHNLPNNELYFHPDDLIPNENKTWRELVAQQNTNNNLLPAHELYKPPIYNALFEKYGKNLFIFSAGWGIVSADYKLPKYNITFSHSSKIPLYARRNHNDVFNDFNQLTGIEKNERIVFIAGKDYVKPFCELTEHLPNEKTIIYKSQNLFNENQYIDNNNFTFLHYQTNTNTNWHYEFAWKLVNNEIQL